jgi:hypothetical protein
MAILYSYPQATPDLTDLVLGSKFINGEGLVTKSFSISEIANLVQHVERPYEIYTAILTQTGSSNTQSGYGDETFTLGVTYTIVANPDNYDLTIYGAPNNNVGTSFVSNQTTVLPYTASLEFEYDTGAPVAIVLENTIGNIWFTYENVGAYYAASNALFPGDKTTCITSQSAYEDTGVTFIYRDTENKIAIETQDFFTPGAADDILARTMLEIRVYN